jgi:hypothetical protein
MIVPLALSLSKDERPSSWFDKLITSGQSKPHGERA